jgi:3,4-dihydroxy 2-butanone 4-phosphate synthase/GTP cyclohydrolase II
MNTVEGALKQLARGGLIIVTDDKSRENEGDFVLAAEFATPEKINFMVTHGRGLVCTPLTPARAKKLGLRLMTAKNTARYHTQFTVSVDSKRGITTGISAHDRAKTIKLLAGKATRPRDLVQPGHLFPIIAHPKGLAGRRGHTEASLELLRRAGLEPVSVLCEILTTNGRAANGNELKALAKKFKLPLIAVADIT